MTQRLDDYAELIVRVGANVQPGQTLYVTALVEHAPLVRALGRAAYGAGARLVDVRYVDNHLRRSFIEHAAEEDLSETTPWLMARTEALADGGALIMIAGDPEPELLADLDQERVGKARPIDAANRQLLAQNERRVNWTIAAFPTEGQARQMFGEPDVERLWDAVAHSVRLDEADPVEAWREHVGAARRALRPAQRGRLRRDPVHRAGNRPDRRADPRLPLVGRRRHDRRRHRARGRTSRPRRSSTAPTGGARRARCARRGRSRSAARSSTTSSCGSQGGECVEVKASAGADAVRGQMDDRRLRRTARRGRAGRRRVARRPDRAHVLRHALRRERDLPHRLRRGRDLRDRRPRRPLARRAARSRHQRLLGAHRLHDRRAGGGGGRR